MLFARRKLGSFDVAVLHLGGMRFLCDCEITREGETAVLIRYDLRFDSGQQRRVPRVRAERPFAEVLDLFNRCGVLGWDGFHGPHPRGVLDGIVFRFTLTAEGKQIVAASGSQNFPRHFHDLRDYIETTLRESGQDLAAPTAD